MKRKLSLFFQFLFVLLVLLAPLVLFVTGLPVAAEYAQRWRIIPAVLTLYALLLIYYFGRKVGLRIKGGRIVKAVPALLLLTAFIALYCFRAFLILQGATVILACFAAVLLLGGIAARCPGLPAPALVSLVFTITNLFFIEIFFDALPSGLLAKEVATVPPLAPKDRGNAVFRKNGFRGDRPCRECATDGVRIFTMGGSSTFGTPMFYRNDTYTAYLARAIERRRVDEKIEVYNAGIPGYGITQIVDSIEKEIVQYHPDIITICAWFNDSSAIPGWYGYHDRSDREAQELVEQLRLVQASKVYRKVSGTKLYGVFRFLTLRLQKAIVPFFAGEKKGRHRPRMSPEEFEWGLEKVVELSKKYNFLPVLIYEATSRPTALDEAILTNRYYQVVQKAAERHKLPIVNALDELSRYRAEWLFYDFIHPNQRGHQIIGERLYDALFGSELNDKLAALWKRKGIALSRPIVEHEYKLQFSKKQLVSSALEIVARGPRDDSQKQNYLLELEVDGESTLIQTGLGHDEKRFQFRLDPVTVRRPLADLVVRVRRMEGEAPDDDPLQNPPLPFELISAHIVDGAGKR